MNALRLIGLLALLPLAGCDVLNQNSAPVAAAPVCYRHDPLGYSPILIRINLHASYPLDDPDGFYRDTPSALMDALDDANSNTYKIADGVDQNLTFEITVTDDGEDHYGAIVTVSGNGEGYLFNFNLPQNYVTSDKLMDDIAAQINEYVTEGWHRGNCG